MNPRSANVIIYKFKNQQVDRKLPCRLCVGKIPEGQASHFCWNIRDRRCCSYLVGGFNGDNPCTRNFHFDNTKHIPVLTTTECRICPDKICKVTTNTNCPRTNIFHLVLTYIQNITRIFYRSSFIICFMKRTSF